MVTDSVTAMCEDHITLVLDSFKWETLMSFASLAYLLCWILTHALAHPKVC